MINFKLRWLCYGIVVSSIVWGFMVYTFLSEVGSHKNLPIENKLPSNSKKDNRVHFVPKFRRKDWQNDDENIAAPDQKEHAKEHFNDKLKEIKKSKLNKVAPADIGGKGDDDFLNLGMVRNDEDRMMRDDGYRQHAFNELVSSRIGLHRNVTDTRHPL